jgi:hypothetical protein
MQPVLDSFGQLIERTLECELLHRLQHLPIVTAAIVELVALLARQHDTTSFMVPHAMAPATGYLCPAVLRAMSERATLRTELESIRIFPSRRVQHWISIRSWTRRRPF